MCSDRQQTAIRLSCRGEIKESIAISRYGVNGDIRRARMFRKHLQITNAISQKQDGLGTKIQLTDQLQKEIPSPVRIGQH
jgi:hypothetical protein